MPVTDKILIKNSYVIINDAAIERQFIEKIKTKLSKKKQ